MLVPRINLNANRAGHNLGLGDWDFDPLTGEWVELPTVTPDGPVYTVTTTATAPPLDTIPNPTPMLDPNRDDGLPGKSPCNPNGLYPTGHRCAAVQAIKDSQAVIRVVQTAAGVKQPAVAAGGGIGLPSLPSLDSITGGISAAAQSAAQFVSRNAPAVILTIAILMLGTSIGGGPGGFASAPAPRRRGRG